MENIDKRDYEHFNADGDLLDKVLMEDFDLRPKYAMYQIVRELVLLSLKYDDTPIDTIIENYCNDIDRTTQELQSSLATCFRYSKKKLVKNGSTPYTLMLMSNRYKALLNQGKQK